MKKELVKLKHDWNLGWKPNKGFYVDTCKKCGTLQLTPDHLMPKDHYYIKPEEAIKFKTTNKSVVFYEYFSCIEKEVSKI